VRFKRLVHRLKQDLEMVSIDEGIQIDWREKQFSTADSPRVAI
jgi:hypothetical protein